MRTRSVGLPATPLALRIVRRLVGELVALALVMMTLVAVVAPDTAAAAPAAAAPAAAASGVPLGTMRATDVSSTHPKLLIDASGFEAMRSRITTDVTLASWYRVLKIRADALLTQPVLTAPTAGAMLATSEALVDRTYTLAFVWQMTGDKRYADRLWGDLAAASSFPTWNPDHFLDTASMAHAFAIGFDWVYPYWTAAQRQQLAAAVSLKAFTPGLQNYRAGGYWTAATSNWNVICNSGLGLAALAFSDALPGPSNDILEGVSSSIGSGLTEYGPDGGYEEGLSYWSWATGYLATFVAGLKSSTGDDYGILATPGLSQTGRFAVDASGASGRLFNYGDATSTQPLTQTLLGLSKLYDDDVLLQRALMGFRWRDADEISARTMVWFTPMTTGSRESTSSRPLDSVYRGVGVASMRGSWTSQSATSVAMRAATTDSSSHANLDAGDFTLDALGVQWAAETGGSDQYDLPGMLDSQPTGGRWSYYRNRPEGQNSLVINPNSGAGAAVNQAASVSLLRSDPDSAASVADLDSAYRAGGVTWKRGVSLFDGRSRVVVQDEVSSTGTMDAWWFMHTEAAININADGRSAVLTKDGQQLLARIVSGGGTTFSRMAASPLPGSPDPTGQSVAIARKLAIHLPSSAAFTLAVEFTPLTKGVSTPAAAAVTPLTQWARSTPSAQLKGLYVDGQQVQNFVPGVTYYTRGASDRDAPPVVTATSDPGANAVVTQAMSVPGSATVRVTRVGAADSVYRIVFTLGALVPVAIVATSGDATVGQLFDGSTADGWKVTGTQSATFDFGVPRSIKYVQTFWPAIPDKGALFEFWGSSDSQIWTKLFYGSNWVGQNTVTTTLPDPVKPYRYLRFVALGGGAGDPVTVVSELQAFSNIDSTVTSGSSDPAAALRMTQDKGTLEAGAVVPLTWTAIGADGKATDLPRARVNFASSNPSVASVDSAGNVTAKVAGQARLTAASTIGSDFVSGSVQVTVTDALAKSVTASRDSYVLGGDNAGKNYGTANWMQVKSKPAYPSFEQNSLIGFSLAGYTGASIESAKLLVRGWVDGGGTANLDAYAASGTWTETGVTFDNQPKMEYRVGGTAVDGTEAWREMDVTDYIRQRSGSDVTFALRQDRPSGGLGPMMLFRTRESALPPQLQIRLRDSSVPTTPPVITSALSNSTDGGRVTGTVRAAPNSVVKVNVGVSTRSTCAPVMADTAALAPQTVTANAQGVAPFSTNGIFKVGQGVLATATVSGKRSVVSGCSKVAQDPRAQSRLVVPVAEDSYVIGGSSSAKNYGTQNWAQVLAKPAYPTFEQLTYLKFGLGGAAQANLESATLVFTSWVSPANITAQLSAYGVAGTWSETGLTFANKPDFGYKVGSTAIDSKESVRTMDVTDYIRQSVGGTATLGIRQDSPPGGIGPQIFVRTRESSAAAYLDLRYRPAQSARTITPTATPRSGTVAFASGTMSARPTFSLAFNEPVVGLPTAGTTSRLILSTGTTRVAATVSYNASRRTATLVSNSPLTVDTRYTLMLSSEVRDVTGHPLVARNWTVTTGPAPTLRSRSVAPGATKVSRTVNVVTGFSEAVVGLPTTRSVSARYRLVETVSRKTVASTVIYSAPARAATLNPTATLRPRTSYTVMLESTITDKVKNPLTATSWKFTTRG